MKQPVIMSSWFLKKETTQKTKWQYTDCPGYKGIIYIFHKFIDNINLECSGDETFWFSYHENVLSFRL